MSKVVRWDCFLTRVAAYAARTVARSSHGSDLERLHGVEPLDEADRHPRSPQRLEERDVAVDQPSGHPRLTR